VKPLERVEVTKEQVVSTVRLLPAPSLLDPGDQRVFLRDDPTRETTTLR